MVCFNLLIDKTLLECQSPSVATMKRVVVPTRVSHFSLFWHWEVLSYKQGVICILTSPTNIHKPFMRFNRDSIEMPQQVPFTPETLGNDTFKDLKAEFSDCLCYTEFQLSRSSLFLYVYGKYIYGKNPSWSIPSTLWFPPHRLTLSVSGFYFRSGRQKAGRGKNKKGLQEEVAVYTPKPESDSLPSLHVLQPSVVSEDIHTREQSIPKPRGEIMPWVSLTTQPASRGAMQQPKGEVALKDVQTTPEILAGLCATWETCKAENTSTSLLSPTKEYP